jgi:hypothetical protein
MNNSIDEIRNEYERVSNAIQNERATAFMKRMLLLGVQGVEMLNTKFDPLGVDLEGWNESMGYSLENQEYDEVLSELYEKYKSKATMSPEIKLIFMIISSAAMFTISKKLMQSDSIDGLKNMFDKLTNRGQKPQHEQNFQTPQDLESTEDLPSKIKGPNTTINLDNNEIDNILQTMKKQETLVKQKEVSENTDDIFKSIPIKTPKTRKPRAKKATK